MVFWTRQFSAANVAHAQESKVGPVCAGVFAKSGADSNVEGGAAQSISGLVWLGSVVDSRHGPGAGAGVARSGRLPV